jgi:putative FmdB family regulatory protein
LPTYQYACTECGHGFEAVQSFTDDALTECPQCTGRLRKVFNSVGIVFKGSGFYRTDSREKAGVGAGKDGAKDSPGAKADGKKSESTPGGTSSGSGSASGSAGSGSTSSSGAAASTSGSGSSSTSSGSATSGSAA